MLIDDFIVMHIINIKLKGDLMKNRIIILFTTVLVVSFVALEMDIIEATSCPAGSSLTTLQSDMSSVKAVWPLNFRTLKSTGAWATRKGSRLAVCLSNGEYPISKMGSSFVSPIKNKAKFIAVIQFSNGKNPVKAGTYSPTAGYNQPFWVFAEVRVWDGKRGVTASLGIRKGTATITKITDTNVCGTFNLSNKSGSNKIAGRFNVPLEKSRW